MANLMAYNQSGTMYFPMFLAGGTAFAGGTDWTPGGSSAVVLVNGTIAFAKSLVIAVPSKLKSDFTI